MVQQTRRHRLLERRCGKVALANDADGNGIRICNPMITCLFRILEQQVYEGHVSMLETPVLRGAGPRLTCGILAKPAKSSPIYQIYLGAKSSERTEEHS